MSETTTRFLLPFIIPGQAQKELFHNEALVRIDALLHAAVEDAPQDDPPEAPLPGQCWIAGSDPEGDWDGQPNKIVTWTEGGWRFIAPDEGCSLWNKAAALPLRWDGTEWVSSLAATGVEIGGVQVLGDRQPSVPNPSGGTIIDAEARSAIAGVIAALRSHGLIE